MKIIGKTKDGYLLEASERDMAALYGFTSEYSTGYKRSERSIGEEIPVQDAREAAEFVKAWSADRVKSAKTAVQSIADSLDKMDRIFPPKP